MKRAALTAAALLIAASASHANAAVNLVANPGFETGDFTSWTHTNGLIYVSGASHNSGSYGATLYDYFNADSTASVSEC